MNKQKKKCFASFYGRTENGEIEVELHYSWLMFLSGNQRWFCRFWNGYYIVGESYGKTKFEAYRKALKAT